MAANDKSLPRILSQKGGFSGVASNKISDVIECPSWSSGLLRCSKKVRGWTYVCVTNNPSNEVGKSASTQTGEASSGSTSVIWRRMM